MASGWRPLTTANESFAFFRILSCSGAESFFFLFLLLLSCLCYFMAVFRILHHVVGTEEESSLDPNKLLYVQLLDYPRNALWNACCCSIRRCQPFPCPYYKETYPLGYLMYGVFYRQEQFGDLNIVMCLVCGYTNDVSCSIFSSLFQVIFRSFVLPHSLCA